MRRLLFGVLGALALVGCGGGGGSSKASTRVSFVNASPDAGALDFTVNGSKKATAIPYATATDFSNVDSGDDDFGVAPNGSSETIWSEADTLTADTDTLIMAIGLRTPPADADQTPPVTETDKRLVLSFSGVDRTPPNGNVARILVVHGLVRQAGYPTPNVDFLNPGDTPLIEQDNIAFGSLVAKDVDAGSQTFEVRQNDTDQVLVSPTTFNLAPGKIYIALVSGFEGTTGDQAPAIRLIPLTTRAK